MPCALRGGRHGLAPLLALLAFGCAAPTPPEPVWTQAPPLPLALANNAVAALASPRGLRFYSFLGIDRSRRFDGITRRAFRWLEGDPAWEEIAPLPGPPRIAATAQAVAGKLFVFGGYSVAPDGQEKSHPTVAIFDPVTGRWSLGAPIPVPVDDAVSGVSADGLVYLISGWRDRNNVTNVQVYDPVADRWAQATPIPGPPVFGHAGAVSGHTIVYVDGVQRLESPRRFEMARASWLGAIDPRQPTRIAWRALPPHPGPARYRAAAGPLGARLVFCGGTDHPYNFDGVGYDGVPAVPMRSCFAYRLASGTWIGHPPLPEPSMDHRGLAAAAGRAAIVGGMGRQQRVLRSVRLLRAP